jgi:hypothetical protein
MPKLADLTGQKYGCLTLLSRAENRNGQTYWLCECDCGVRKKILVANVKRGLSRSCGCKNREATAKRNATHRMSQSPEYKVWSNMQERCNSERNKSFKDWGGRGIRVLYDSFESFLQDVGPRPSPVHQIDRIDNDGHYQPGNVRWATREQQSRNRRSNVLLEYQGRRQCIADWADEAGITWATLAKRLKRGWPIEKALGLATAS